MQRPNVLIVVSDEHVPGDEGLLVLQGPCFEPDRLLPYALPCSTSCTL